MATYEDLMKAARNADAAGDEDAARRLVQMAMNARNQSPSPLLEIGQDLPMEAAQPNGQQPLISDQDLADYQATREQHGRSVASALNKAGEAMTFGLIGDEAAGAFDQAIGRGDAAERTEFYRQQERDLEENNPGVSLAAEIGGSMVLPGGAISAARGLLPRIGVGAAAGGSAGATYGFMEGEGGLDNRLADAQRLGVLGAVLGGAVPLAGSAISRGFDKVRQNRAIAQQAAVAPSPDQVRAQANAIYDQLDNADVSTQGIMSLADDIANQGRSLGMDTMLTPSAARVSDNITELADEAGTQIPWREIDRMRRQAAVPAGDLANRTQSNIGTMMTRQIDDFVDSVAPELGEAGAEARRLWGVLRRSELLDDAFKRAETAASGFENGLQQEFRRILRSDKLSRGFSDLEKQAMENVVNPGPLRGLLRQVGRLGFSLDGGSNAVGGGFGMGMGAVFGGPVGAALTTVLGTGARTASQKLRVRDANRARAVVRMLDDPILPALTNQRKTMLDEILLRSVRGGTMVQ